ncbi:MAG TPA: hypothetical protein PLI18_15350 [Pirellulaceae bacterium]|nr:hypothetical protein [Pirellulaceae bacterium]
MIAQASTTTVTASASADPLTFAIGVACWIGVAAITIALLVLGRTRWGQVKPLWKCLVLSILAHLLLFALAYTIRIGSSPYGSLDDPVAKLRVVDWDDPIDATAADLPDVGETRTLSIPPWEGAPAPRLPDPEAPPIEAPASDATERSNETTEVERRIPIDPPPAADPPPIESAPPERIASRSTEATPIAAAPIEGSPTDPVGAPEPFERTLIDTAELLIPDVPLPELPIGLPREAPDREAADRTALAQDRVERAIAIPSERSGSNEPDRLVPDPATPHRDPNDASADWTADGSYRNWLAAGSPPLRLGDGAPVPELYRMRLEARAGRRLPPGATIESEEAVRMSLQFFAAHQEADGRWDASRFEAGREEQVLGEDRGGAGGNADTAITGLVLLSLLGHGETHLEGEYRESVQHGLEFLIRSQGSDGNLFGEAEPFARMYAHGIATIALAEATAMSGDPRLQQALAAALAYTRSAQDPVTGGWRYRPFDSGDMSQFGWQIMALEAGEQAGIPIPESTLLGARRFLESCSSGAAGGRCSYRPREQPSATMTAEGLACRYFLDHHRDAPRVREALETILAGDPEDAPNRPNLYFLYYAALGLQQHGGPEWERWNVLLQRRLQEMQIREGETAGSWSSETRWGGYGGRLYSTAIATLCLEMPYRYLPLRRLDESIAPTGVATGPTSAPDAWRTRR